MFDPGDLEMGVAAFVRDDRGRVLFIRENYGGRRYGFPGGAVEPGESLHDALVRECHEEVSCDVAVNHLIAIDYSRTETGGWWLYALFDCRLVGGVPVVSASGEIAEVLWVDPHAPPGPLTNAARKFLSVAAEGERGVVGWLNRVGGAGSAGARL